MTPEIQTFLLAMTPVGELRVAIPVGLTIHQLSPAAAYFIAVLGNIFAVFLILTFLGAFSRWSSRHIYFFNRFFTWLFSRTKRNHQEKVKKYGIYLLPFFVALPLPITGGWTGSLIAFVFGMPFKKTFPLISLGIMTAGLIVLFLSQAGIAVEKSFGWQILIGIIVSITFVWLIFKKLKNNKKITY